LPQTAAGGLGLQQRPHALADRDLLLAGDVAGDRQDLGRRVGLQRQREVKPRRQTGIGGQKPPHWLCAREALKTPGAEGMWSGVNIPKDGRGRTFALRQLRSLAAHGGFDVAETA
jgi:hypothetical protein